MKSRRFVRLAAAMLAATAMPVAAAETDFLAAFSDPSRIWGNGIEMVLEQAFRDHFRTRIIAGRVMNVRMPFTMNYERSMLLDERLDVVAGGKGSTTVLWPIIDGLLASDDFALYARTLSDGNEQVVIFDMEKRSWESSRDFRLIAEMRAGLYSGLPHRPHVLVSGNGIDETDVYNYLHVVGRVGMDCSGFVWNALAFVARRGGVNLGRILGPSMGVPRGGDPAMYAGTVFFNSRNPNIVSVNDKIANLRPADVILFRGPDGQMSHSAIIQSVDFEKGIVRYFQSTDIAGPEERGVHESFVHFDPANPGVSLGDTSLRWTKMRLPPFAGESEGEFGDDGARFRAFAELGGGRVVRLRAMGSLKFGS